MSNCKPGDLAVIVCDRDFRVDLGKIVEVVRFYEIDRDGDLCWLCKSIGGLLTSSEGVDIYADIPDAWLRPIRPGDTEDETPAEIINEVAACSSR